MTRLAARIGWDDLLKCRSGVFVMEEEYRILKAKEEERKTSFSQHSLKAAKDSSTPSVQTTATSTVDQIEEEQEGTTNEKKVEEEEEETVKEKQQTEEQETSEKKEEEEEEEDNNNKESQENDDDKKEEAEVSEKMENVDLNDESKTTDLPKMDEHSLERPQQAAEESKVN